MSEIKFVQIEIFALSQAHFLYIMPVKHTFYLSFCDELSANNRWHVLRKTLTKVATLTGWKICVLSGTRTRKKTPEGKQKKKHENVCFTGIMYKK